MINIAALMAPARPKGHGDIDQFEAEEFLLQYRGFDDDAALGERGVEKNHMGHDRGTEDTGGQKNAFATLELRRYRTFQYKSPIRLVEDRFDEVTNSDDPDECRYNRFKRAEAAPFQSEDQERDDRCNQTGEPERNTEQQIEAHRCSEKFGKIGGHRHPFHQAPHDPDQPGRILFATNLGQIFT